MTAPMAVALIGYGAWGRYHARALAATPSARLTVIAARGEAASTAGADWPQARVLGDWREAVADPAIEAVFVAVPNHLHAEVALAALGAGKHVLLEKPMALTLAACDALVAAARASGRVLTIGHELRLSTQFGRIAALIDEGAIGRPEAVQISLFRFPYRSGAGGWRYDRARVGSWLLEEAVHHADLALWWLRASGEPVSLRADTVGDPAMPRAFSVTLRFADGAAATLVNTVAGFEHHLAVAVIGESGSIRALWSAAMDRAETATASLHLFRGCAAPGARAEALDFAPSGEVHELATQAERAIRGFRAGRALVTPEEGRAAVAACLLAERSAREGREIAWREACG
ncbi:Gfo/Idh/MocA family protein [Elioraea sp.]|uniref:Gfo/Idh/MocA family protein n=1 Tax=Elioraea sp. TaxID=2185103 RepID=UPI00262E7BAB|nr:Gfo/Idh/MocA family oxidoreductase [Elioraea sp.]